VASSIELAAQRKQTQALLDRGNAIRVVLNHATVINDSSGGTKPGAPVSRVQQTFHWSQPSTQLPERVTPDGSLAVPEYILIGRYDAAIERGDWFYHEGVKYQVVFIHPDKSYEIRAEVVYRG
jgi:hypothetical protein